MMIARSPQELLERLRIVLDRLRDVGLKAKPSKCELFLFDRRYAAKNYRPSKIYTQDIIPRSHGDGINPLPDKLEAIRDWPVPHCLRDVRAFFGLASYYRRFVKGFATIAEPLTRLTRKMARFEWTDEAQQAFEALKEALVEATSLAFPLPQEPCIFQRL